MVEFARDHVNDGVQEACLPAMVIDASLIVRDVPSPLRLFAPPSAIGRPLAATPLPISVREVIAAVQVVLDGAAVKKLILLSAKHSQWYLLRISAYDSTEVRGCLVTFDDVSEVQAEIRHGLSRKVIETRHSIRNMLSVVRSLVLRSIQHAENLEDYAERVEGRLSAITRIQSATLLGTETGVDLEYLIAEEFIANGMTEGQHFSLSGPSIRLRSNAAEALSLAIHELWRNAFEHGSLRDDSGSVAVLWEIAEQKDAPAILRLCWRENGPGGSVQLDTAGYGREIIEQSLTFALGARVRPTENDGGIAWAIEAPLDRITEASEDNR